MIVYLITNLINQKRYVGITVRKIHQRFQQHCDFKPNKKHKKSAISEAIQLYGKENFKIEQIDTASTIEELKEKEKICRK
jgi:group I intron endonuclease